MHSNIKERERNNICGISLWYSHHLTAWAAFLTGKSTRFSGFNSFEYLVS